MTKAQYKDLLLMGSGRCYLAVRQNPKRYEDILLWACKNVISYDQQSCGTHAEYLYSLHTCYPSTARFLNCAVSVFTSLPARKDELFSQLAELLVCYANDGAKAAKTALWEKYESLYARLKERKRRASRRFYELENYEKLCILLAQGNDFFKIAEDVGNLLSQGKPYVLEDFDQFFFLTCKPHKKALRLRGKSNPAFALLLKGYLAEEKLFKKFKATSQKPQTNEGDRYAFDELFNENSRLPKFKIFRYLSENPSLLDFDKLLSYAKEEGYARDLAIEIMQEFPHEKALIWALERISQENVYDLLPVLLVNYRPKRKRLILTLLRSLSYSFDSDEDWHSVISAILDMRLHGIRAPKEFLYFAYERNYCSFCRYYAVKELKRRRLLTEEIRAELPYDANEDTRALAGN